MNSADYWLERERQNMHANMLTEEEQCKELERIYRSTMQDIQADINNFYAKYAGSEGISIGEAQKRVSELDIEAYGRKAERYVAEKNFSKKANAEMKLYNLTMKVNRLEMLKSEIGLELVRNFSGMEEYFDQALYDRAMKEFERQAGILGDTVINTTGKARSLVGASFHGATFSDRIWADQALLKSELDGLLRMGLIKGSHPRDLARRVRKVFDTSIYNSERLLITELTRVQTEAQMESFIRNGFEEYRFIDCEDRKVCATCKSIHGKCFPVKDMMPGTNAPPMHPNCRCSVAAHMDDIGYKEWLDSYKDHGLSFQEWKKDPKQYKAPGGKLKELEGLPKLNEIKGNKGIESFATKLIDNLGIDRENIDIAVTDLRTPHARGYCMVSAGVTDTLRYDSYCLKKNDKRSMAHRVKTAFHESFHLLAHGRKWDGNVSGEIADMWRDLEETFTESAANYLFCQYDGSVKLSPSYAEKLVTNLPRLKKLDKFKDCKSIEDFGRMAYEERKGGKGAEWNDLAEYKRKRTTKKYLSKYHEYIKEHQEELFDMMLEGSPEVSEYRNLMVKDLERAMDKKLSELSNNERVVYYNIIACAMQEVGIK